VRTEPVGRLPNLSTVAKQELLTFSFAVHRTYEAKELGI
jgi:hypothetical protein